MEPEEAGSFPTSGPAGNARCPQGPSSLHSVLPQLYQGWGGGEPREELDCFAGF